MNRTQKHQEKPRILDLNKGVVPVNKRIESGKARSTEAGRGYGARDHATKF